MKRAANQTRKFEIDSLLDGKSAKFCKNMRCGECDLPANNINHAVRFELAVSVGRWYLFYGAVRQRGPLASEFSLIWSYSGPCRNKLI